MGGISPLVEMVSCWAVFLDFLGCGQGGLAENFHELFINWIVNIWRFISLISKKTHCQNKFQCTKEPLLRIEKLVTMLVVAFF